MTSTIATKPTANIVELITSEKDRLGHEATTLEARIAADTATLEAVNGELDRAAAALAVFETRPKVRAGFLTGRRG